MCRPQNTGQAIATSIKLHVSSSAAILRNCTSGP